MPAGSLRRRRPECGDVEHVVLPEFAERPAADLFGGARRVNLLWERLDGLLAAGAVAKHVYGAAGFRRGEKYCGVEFGGRLHEFWTTDRDNRGSTIAIRTGPGGYGRMLVTRLQRHGHVNLGGHVLSKGRVDCGWSGQEPAWVAAAAPGARGRVTGIVRAPGGPSEAYAVCPACSATEAMTMPRVAVPTGEAYFRLCGLPFGPPEQRFDP